MAFEVPQYPPSEVRIGTSWFWNVSYADAPASAGWELNLYFRGPSDLTIVWASAAIAASGDEFQVRITPTLAADLTTAGTYRLIATVTLSGEVHEVEDRHLLVLPASATAVNAKSHNRQVLEAIQAALLTGVATSPDAQRVTIAGRTIEYRSTDDLLKLEATYLARVAIEENPNGRIIDEVEFVRAGR